MEHLLTVASAEFDGGTYARWLPLEERHVWGGPYEARKRVQSGPGLMLGDLGDVYVFLCRACAGRPEAHVFQGC